MLFPTLQFALFFCVVFILYWYVFRQKKQRIILLTCASYVFYACWNWRFCLLLFGVSVCSAVCGAILGIQKNYIPRTVTMLIGTVLHILFLIFFKYFYDITSFFNHVFFNGRINAPLLTALQNYSLLLPVGISYYTFRSMSYLFDIYLCKMRPARSCVEVLLYISFFPQLASGPIVQAAAFFSTLEANLTRDTYMVRPIAFDRSVVLILSGLYKKIVLATFLSVLAVDPVFANPAQCNTLELIIGLLSYTFVIYCDFSGYSDMAIGVGLLLGFETPPNFNRPYLSQSVSEFWRRWHISFSLWLREYVYFSFGGSRYGLVRTVCALIGTMLIAGIWHGGSIPFVLWGLLQGTACAVERVAARISTVRKSARTPAGSVEKKHTAHRWLHICGVFIFINISWLIFRSNTIQDIARYGAALKNITQPLRTVHWFVLVPLVAAFLLQIPKEETRSLYFLRYTRLPFLVKALTVVLFFAGLATVSTSGMAPFIYFGF